MTLLDADLQPGSERVRRRVSGHGFAARVYTIRFSVPPVTGAVDNSAGGSECSASSGVSVVSVDTLTGTSRLGSVESIGNEDGSEAEEVGQTKFGKLWVWHCSVKTAVGGVPKIGTRLVRASELKLWV